MDTVDAVRQRVQNAVAALAKEMASAGQKLEVTFAETAGGITVTVMGAGDGKPKGSRKSREDSADGDGEE